MHGDGRQARKLAVQGTVRVPGDKSISHRALIFAAMARGTSRIEGLLQSADVHSTAALLRALGAHIPTLADSMQVVGAGIDSFKSPSVILDCGNSGTTARLMAGVLAGLAGRTATLDGDSSLRRRPMRRVAEPLRRMGAHIEFMDAERPDLLPMQVRGKELDVIEFTSSHASAQVKSAIMLAALAARVGVTVREPYRSRDHTERMLAARGVSLELLSDGVRLAPHQEIAAGDVDVPADPSSAAFFAALASLADTGSLRLERVGLNPTRTGFFDVLRRMGGQFAVEEQRIAAGETIGTIVVQPASLTGTTVRGAEIPRCIDELPIIACLAARAEGETRITDAGELRVKESDRISAVVANLRAIGVDAEELPDGMAIRGSKTPLRGRISTHGDHRIAMAFGILAACPENSLILDDPACVAVSYPEFWTDLARVVGTDDEVSIARTAPEQRLPPAAPRIPMVDRLVIAIDGPAASGKSSTAQWVAQRLGVRHVDSGAFYRALTALALESELVPEDWTPTSVLAASSRLSWELTERSVAPLIDGLSPDDALRGIGVTRNVSRVARMVPVREWVNERVREAAAASDVVVDGRDIGTAVFPEAPLKIFLIADPWERARRRLLQRLSRLPVDSEIAEETELLVNRDALDATQSAPARDAITIDTTRLTQEEQVERIVALALAARERLVR